MIAIIARMVRRIEDRTRGRGKTGALLSIASGDLVTATMAHAYDLRRQYAARAMSIASAVLALDRGARLVPVYDNHLVSLLADEALLAEAEIERARAELGELRRAALVQEAEDRWRPRMAGCVRRDVQVAAWAEALEEWHP